MTFARLLSTACVHALPILLLSVASCTDDVPAERGGTPPVEPRAVPSGGSTAIDFPAPRIGAPSLTGEPVHLDSLRGSAVLVNFWATWCGPCLREMPDLADLHEEFSDRPFEVLGIAYNDPDTAAIEAMTADLGVPYPVLIDGEGRWAEAFGGVYVMPSSFLVNPAGRVVQRISGLVDADSLRSEVLRLMADQP